MAQLLDSVTELQSDPTCMEELARGSGLRTLADAQRTYAAAVRVALGELISVASTGSGANALLIHARNLETPAAPDPRTQFSSTDGTGEDLALQVFRGGLPNAVSAVSAAAGVGEQNARAVLEVTTSALLVAAMGHAHGQLTTDSLTQPLLAEQDALRSMAPLPAAEAEVGITPAASSASQANAPSSATSSSAATSHPGVSLSGKGAAMAGAGVCAAILLLGVGLFWNSQRQDDPDALAFVEGEESLTTETTSTSEEGTATTAPGDPAQPEAENSNDVASPPIPIGAPVNHAVLSGGRIYLRGYVPSEDVEALIVAAVTQIMGPGNVVSEYTIDPTEPFEEGREVKVFIEETVLFATGSAEIAPDFEPLLGLGLTLLQLQDGVTMDVIGHTDSVGGTQANQVLSQTRVDAVKQFFVSLGIDPSRVNAIGRGETEPRASNDTPEGRQANRRVEFVITGFTFSG